MKLALFCVLEGPKQTSRYRLGWAASLAIATVALQPGIGLAQVNTEQSTCINAVAGLANISPTVLRTSEGVLSSGKITVEIAVTERLDLGGGAFADANIGLCEFTDRGELVKIDTLAVSASSPSQFQDFGEIDDIGRFILILRHQRNVELFQNIGHDPAISIGEQLEEPIEESLLNRSRLYLYYSTVGRDFLDGLAVFPALIDDRQEQWWADCLTHEMGRFSDRGDRIFEPIGPNVFAESVVRQVCL